MHYDVAVVGGGHAGCEAAAAAARAGARTVLVTTDQNTIGAMSCNPAIGGVGKGHLVREIDVFDGLIARAADHAAIHYRLLNRSKGGAVHGPRVQADRDRYRMAIQAMMAEQAGITVTVLRGHIADLLLDRGGVAGLRCADGADIEARTVVLATGTFLGGRLFRGDERMEGGRIGEAAANRLAQRMRALKLPMGRLKTGTPPRLDGRTIDWARLARQSSDREPWSMSSFGPGRVAPQIACGLTRTNARTHDLIRGSLRRSPLHDGAIEGRGPRYCPSIEDKVVRFGDRDSHQVFLEPEGLGTAVVYPNGVSTSLPADAQQALVRSIEGLEQVEVVQHGYAVEYDFLDPRSLDARLELRAIPGLFCAGQINGTTGYEEAATQGLVAGLNAAALSLGRDPILFDRRQSYIGVMVDDLTLQGVTEPYRMLTSRAEHRLRLRAGNAATRLGGAARASGAISREREKWLDRRDDLLARMAAGEAGADTARDAIARDVRAELTEDRLYAPYVERQEAELARVISDEHLSLRLISSFDHVPGLSNEMIERLEAARPLTLGAAGRIRGITPAALAALALATRRRAA